MQSTVGDFIVERMHAWGVRRIFGYPGDGINGVVGAIGRQHNKQQEGQQREAALSDPDRPIEWVQARHEEMAAFMACGHAKATGQVGVCLATGGPGAIHLLTGLYDAKADHQPVVAIVGDPARTSLGGSYQQEVDLASLFSSVSGEYTQMITTAQQARHVIDRAFRIAIAERCPTCVIIPTDVQSLPAEPPARKHFTTHSGLGYSWPLVVPTQADLERAAAILNEGKRIAILVGAGARGASAEVMAVADILQAGIAKALLGKDVIDDSLSHVTGTIGLLGTEPTHDMMAHCDTLLMLGSGFPYSEFLPKEGQARGVQVDIDPRMLGLRYPMEINLHGDCKATLAALIPLLRRDRGSNGEWRARIEGRVVKWRETLVNRAMIDADPVNPQRVFHELGSRLPRDAIVATDTGSTVFWFARHVPLTPSMRSVHSGNLASMGAAIPYAIAAKMAEPSRPVIAMLGDGAMQMSGLNEMITIARHWRSWSNPVFAILVLNNRDLNFVTWEQRIIEGDAKFEASQEVPDFSYAAYARMLGFRGIVVERPDDVGPAWDAALSATEPLLIEAIVDPNVPMLPPHITFEQARNYLKAILHGDPDAARFVKASVKEILA